MGNGVNVCSGNQGEMIYQNKNIDKNKNTYGLWYNFAPSFVFYR